MNAPLAIDEGFELACRTRDGQFNLGSRVAKWLQRFSPLLVYYEIPYGRYSVENQLALRPEFSEGDWLRCGANMADVIPTLKIIQKELDWPNHHFLPNDPSRLALIEKYDELAVHEVFAEIQKHTGKAIPKEELGKVLERGSMLELVTFIQGL